MIATELANGDTFMVPYLLSAFYLIALSSRKEDTLVSLSENHPLVIL